jgi:hypothetical protein
VTPVLLGLAQALLGEFVTGLPTKPQMSQMSAQYEPKVTERESTVDRLLGTAHRLEWRRWLIRC